jgi:rRNA maturation endonuclease Nob1
MARNNVGCLLVVDEGRLIGIITRDDLVRTIHTRQELELGYHTVLGLPSREFQRNQASHCIQCVTYLTANVQFCPQCGALRLG